MAIVPIYVLAGQSNANRIEAYYGVRSALADLGGPSVVVHKGHTASGLTENPAADDWNPASPGELFDDMMAGIKDAFDAAIAAGDTPVLGGVFWVQGERDAESADAANAYLENLELFVQGVRGTYGEEFPFVIAELRTTSAPWSFHEIVREAQHEIALENGDNVILVETDDFSLDDDLVHYDIPGRHDLGQALVDTIADAHLDLVGDQAVTDPQVLKGLDVADDLVGGLGDDVVAGRDGIDTIFGGDGDDILLGGSAADSLYGGDGDDTLHGGAGNDLLVGGEGVDRIFGGARNDRLVGGEGADRFFFQGSDGAGSTDVIVDFLTGTDKIVVRGQAISQVTDTADGALVQFDTGASVLILDVSLSQLGQVDFVFQAGGSGDVFRI